MSYTELKVVPRQGDIEGVQEFRNSWGFAARVWQAMQERYLPQMGKGSWLGNGRAVWDLWKEERVPRYARLVLLSTFDHAIVEWERLPEMAAHYRQFAREFPAEAGAADHLPAIADAFENLHTERSAAEMAGVCFYPMSVARDLWRVYDDGEEESRSYDLICDIGHFFVFAELEEHERETTA